ncbi:flagellar protein [Paenibacillus sp. sgz5001063]|uniref:flagellar protein n=1 Tax=Paenibacillus sp. sgz5001063 TaxID=3242474 RepID=UPI0036D292D9
MNLGNCSLCGKLFTNNFRDICPSCAKLIDLDYDKCVKYLREMRTASIQDVHEATEVSISRITKFIKEGRISVANNPNIMYPCEVCGILIRENNMCDSCRSRLTREISEAGKDKSQYNQNNKKNGGAYSAVDKFRD